VASHFETKVVEELNNMLNLTLSSTAATHTLTTTATFLAHTLQPLARASRISLLLALLKLHLLPHPTQYQYQSLYHNHPRLLGAGFEIVRVISLARAILPVVYVFMMAVVHPTSAAQDLVFILLSTLSATAELLGHCLHGSALYAVWDHYGGCPNSTSMRRAHLSSSCLVAMSCVVKMQQLKNVKSL
jgi:hypothetical protein